MITKIVETPQELRVLANEMRQLAASSPEPFIGSFNAEEAVKLVENRRAEGKAIVLRYKGDEYSLIFTLDDLGGIGQLFHLSFCEIINNKPEVPRYEIQKLVCESFLGDEFFNFPSGIFTGAPTKHAMGRYDPEKITL